MGSGSKQIGFHFPGWQMRLGPLLLVIWSLLWTAYGQTPYLWPTDASRYITSSFCEFRPRHYHAAIDIKTWNRTGYRVFAIEDGHLYRLRIGATGYGKALYLKLRDGRLVVYAHLSRFNARFTALADSLRFSQQRNRVDWFAPSGRFPVKKGEVVGYTGETGIGVPHLHFELRDSNNRPINPLPFYREMLTDRRAPQITALALIPLDARTAINFQPDTLFLTPRANGQWRFEEPIYLTGNAYLALRTYDTADGVENRFDIYRAALWINDSLVYQVQYDRFSYRDTRLIELDKNYALWRSGRGIYHNFYRHPRNILPFYRNTAPEAGLLSGQTLRQGLNTLRVEVADFFGNRNSLILPLFYLPYRHLELYTISPMGDRLLVGLRSPDSLSHLQVHWLIGNPHPVAEATAVQTIASTRILSHYYTTVIVPYRQAANATLRILAEDAQGLPFYPVYIPFQETAREKVHILDYKFRHLELGLWGKGKFHRLAPGKGFFLSLEPNRWYLADLAQHLTHDSLWFELLPDSVKSELQAWQPIWPNQTHRLRSPDGLLELVFEPGSCYDPFYGRVRKVPVAHPVPPGASPVSKAYRVEPFDQPLNRGATLRVLLPDSLKEKHGLGVYYWDRKKGWLFLPVTSAPNQVWHTRVTSLETFVLLQDTLPPYLQPLKTRIRSRPGQAVRIQVLDNCADIYREDQITVRVNGRWTPFDYDPEEKEILIAQRFLPEGKSQLVVEARDNVNNVSRLEIDVFKLP